MKSHSKRMKYKRPSYAGVVHVSQLGYPVHANSMVKEGEKVGT